MPHTPTLTGAARDVLTQQEAADRASRVRQAEYDIRLDLVRGRSTYHGDVTIRFAAQGSGDTFLDFRGKEIELLEVNGSQIQPEWNGYRLILPGAELEVVVAKGTLGTRVERIGQDGGYELR